LTCGAAIDHWEMPAAKVLRVAGHGVGGDFSDPTESVVRVVAVAFVVFSLRLSAQSALPQ
jgi:hypothetical protein